MAAGPRERHNVFSQGERRPGQLRAQGVGSLDQALQMQALLARVGAAEQLILGPMRNDSQMIANKHAFETPPSHLRSARHPILQGPQPPKRGVPPIAPAVGEARFAQK